MHRIRIVATIGISIAAALILGFLVGSTAITQTPSESTPLAIPPVKGFYNGQEILFIHTEASDQQVVSMLTTMMGSPVILVPSLKQVPQSALGDVYVFTNGIKGGGPFGFQADVFSSIPTDENYTPLRALNLVTWKEGAIAKELKSVDEVKAAEARGELAVSKPGVVVNMPIVKWTGGQR